MPTSAYWGGSTSDIAGKILVGESIAGLAGTLTLPAVGKVLSAAAYEVRG
jgi:hypothetical protein